MRYTLRHAIAATAALSLLLLCGRAGFADDADKAAMVRVTYAKGDTEFGQLSDGVKFYTDKGYTLRSPPAELDGLTFTRRAWNLRSDVAIDAPSGATIYLITGGGSLARAARDAAIATGWTKIGAVNLVEENPQTLLAVFKQVLTDPKHVSIPAGGGYGIVVAAKNLGLNTDDNHVEKKPDEPADTTPATTLHIDSAPDTTPIPGPSTRPAQAQATINALEVYEMANGMMLGQTSEATLTLTGSDTPKLVTVRFITKVGDQMCLARDEALRYIHLRYPNWYVSKAEITFEDKYVAHDGGSIGTALGTMILSCIQGFQIDPNVAITGDISANGKTRAIGGVSAKIKGATASKCTIVAIPVDNLDQLVDAVVYTGPEMVTNIQVIGIADLDDAVATVRADRDPQLTQAIALFAEVQKTLKDKPAAVKTKDVQDKLNKVLALTPRHLSAQILLSIAQGKQPKTLSATASLYYTFMAAGSMIDVLKQRGQSDAAPPVPSSVVRTGLANLRKLRPLADPSTRPLIDAWSRFISAWNEMQEGLGSSRSVEEQRQSLLDEMAKENADADLMQKMLKEGM